MCIRHEFDVPDLERKTIVPVLYPQCIVRVNEYINRYKDLN